MRNNRLSRFKIVIQYLLYSSILTVFTSCDFDLPEKFVPPVWNVDLKIPLVQTTYYMSDISDSTNGIFKREDSLGFEIIQEGLMPKTTLPSLPSIPLGLDMPVETGEIPGISVDIDPEFPSIDTTILMVAEGVLAYQDTAKACTTIYTEIAPGLIDTTIICLTDTVTGDTLGKFFKFPNDSIRTMTRENYNTYIVEPINSVLDTLFSLVSQTINLGFNDIPLPEEPALIDEVIGLLIKEDPINSIFSTRFSNNNIPTPLEQVYSYVTTANSEIETDPSLNTFQDTVYLANHGYDGIDLENGEIYETSTELSGKLLRGFLRMGTNFKLPLATEPYVTIPVGSPSIGFLLSFKLAGFETLRVRTNSINLLDGIEMEPVELPEMDMAESGITKMEIYQNQLKTTGTANQLYITNLYSSFPFDLNFVLDFKNFVPPIGSGKRLVRIDSTLNASLNPINDPIDLRGYTLQSTGDVDENGVPYEPFTTFDLELQMIVERGLFDLPLDGSPLGEFTMNMQLQTLEFSIIKADLTMEMPTDPTAQEFPPGLTGAIPDEAKFELIFDNNIRLPIKMNMDFKGINSLGDSTFMPVNIDTLGIPFFPPGDLIDTSVYAKTIVGLDKNGTTITIYDPSTSDTPTYGPVTTEPCSTCASIIDLLASNPTELLINPTVKVEGRGELTSGVGMQGGYKVTIPFSLILEPMTFMGGKATEIEPFDYETRFKIRNGLISSSLVTTIENALPFGANVAVLMSNDSLFPTNSTQEQLNIFRDSLLTVIPWMNSSDSLYIIRGCDQLSPDSGDIYIFNVMTDYSDCMDGLPYIIKNNGSGTDTIFSYVDTLFQFELPTPQEYFGEDEIARDSVIVPVTVGGDNDSTALDTVAYDTTYIYFPEGMVKEQGISIDFPSTIDSSQLFLMTDPGSHFTMPRFFLPGTEGKGVYMTQEDSLNIISYLTLKLSSSIAFGVAENELVLTYPNGGQSFFSNENIEIKWETFGESSEIVDLFYSVGQDSLRYKNKYCTLSDDWVEIASGIENTGTYELDLSTIGAQDSIRIKIISGTTCDINGHFFDILNSSRINNLEQKKTKFTSKNSK